MSHEPAIGVVEIPDTVTLSIDVFTTRIDGAIAVVYRPQTCAQSVFGQGVRCRVVLSIERHRHQKDNTQSKTVFHNSQKIDGGLQSK
jgi:hypothetical protein